MRLPNYTHSALRIAKLARCRAARAGAKKVEPEHLLLALLTSEGILSRAMMESSLDPAKVRQRIAELAHATHLASRSTPRLSGRMEKILFGAEEVAKSLGSSAIRPEHLLLAALREDGPGSRALAEMGTSYPLVRQVLRKLLHWPRPARCSKCGYDVRATPERCPECGDVV